MKGNVFDIQKCSIHDGPGIRTTVFLKGCPLKCQWCHNPESQTPKPLLRYIDKKCVSCGSCSTICQEGVHSFNEGNHIITYDMCSNCHRCVDACPTNALSILGETMSLDKVINIVKKDIPFYKKSGGGVTISGGEPLLQSDFTKGILIQCKALGIHTCVETCGYGSDKQLETIMPYTDLFLFDYKVSNNDESIKYTGVDNKIILKNLDKLIYADKSIILRCPIIPSVNDTYQHYDAIIELLNKYPCIEKAELMAYHNIGISKANQLGIEQQSFTTMNTEDKTLCITYFRDNGINNIDFSI